MKKSFKFLDLEVLKKVVKYEIDSNTNHSQSIQDSLIQ